MSQIERHTQHDRHWRAANQAEIHTIHLSYSGQELVVFKTEDTYNGKPCTTHGTGYTIHCTQGTVYVVLPADD